MCTLRQFWGRAEGFRASGKKHNSYCSGFAELAGTCEVYLLSYANLI